MSAEGRVTTAALRVGDRIRVEMREGIAYPTRRKGAEPGTVFGITHVTVPGARPMHYRIFVDMDRGDVGVMTCPGGQTQLLVSA